MSKRFWVWAWTIGCVLGAASLLPSSARAEELAHFVVGSAQDLYCPAGGSNEGTIYKVTNASSNVDCDTTPELVEESKRIAYCLCSGGSFVAMVPVAAEAPDLSAYAPLAGADFTGPVTMSEDRGVEGSEAISWETTLGAGDSRFRVVATDEDGDAYSLNVGQDGVHYGLWWVNPGGVSPAVTLSSTGALAFDTDSDGTPEATYTATGACVGGPCFFGAASGPLTMICDVNHAGSFYYDNNTENQPCFCNGTNYVLFSDATTVCTDPE